MAKGILKSIRISEDILKMIEAQPGENFTAKFENLVRRCVKELPQKEQELQSIKDAIQRERERLHNAQQKNQAIQTAAYQMLENIKYWSRLTDQATEKLEKLLEEE